MNTLCPLPIVVYAASLALSVSYQQLRYSRLSSDQEDAHKDFNAGCDILQKLRQKWRSADAMAALAKKISGALDMLPRLDILRLNRSTQEGGNYMERNVALPDDHRSGNAPTIPSSHHLPAGYCSETMGLFAGMDDVSWMYLDAENPVSFDVFPEFDELCSTW